MEYNYLEHIYLLWMENKLSITKKTKNTVKSANLTFLYPKKESSMPSIEDYIVKTNNAKCFQFQHKNQLRFIKCNL